MRALITISAFSHLGVLVFSTLALYTSQTCFLYPMGVFAAIGITGIISALIYKYVRARTNTKPPPGRKSLRKALIWAYISILPACYIASAFSSHRAIGLVAVVWAISFFLIVPYLALRNYLSRRNKKS